MNEREQEGLRNRVLDFFKRTDHDYRDAKRPAIVDEEFKPVEGFDRFAQWLEDEIVDTSTFETLSGALIFFSAVITGMQVEFAQFYKDHPNAPANQIDNVIVVLFCLECIVRVLTNGTNPLRYFTGDGLFPPYYPPLSAPIDYRPLPIVVWLNRLAASEWEGRARWNCFDFVVSYLSLVLVYLPNVDGGIVSVVRLMRTLRLLSLMQRFEDLKVILDGFSQGLESFTYIGLLLSLVFYVYAILGFYEFGGNDPVHFGTLGAAMVSLFRTATLAAWYELLYINWFGCNVYGGGAYALAPGVSAPDVDDQGGGAAAVYTGSHYRDDDDEWPMYQKTLFGKYPQFVCGRPEARPTAAFFYFFTFTLLGAFVILSLLMGVVTIAMHKAMESLHASNLRVSRDEKLTRQWRLNPIVYTRYRYGGRSGKQLQYDAGGVPITQLLHPVIGKHQARSRRRDRQLAAQKFKDKKSAARASGQSGVEVGGGSSKRHKFGSIVEESEFALGVETPVRATLKHLMRVAIRGKLEVKQEHMPGFKGMAKAATTVYGHPVKQKSSPAERFYLKVATRCQAFVMSNYYTASFVVFICLYAAVVGMETDLGSDNATLAVLRSICVVAFAVECVVKIVAEGTEPLKYLQDPWNVFDLFVAVSGVVTWITAESNSILNLARLLRLMQVFKLAKKLPKMQLVLEALVYGVRSMVWVAVLFALFNYIFAIIGVILFRHNDPFYFGTIPRAMGTMWLVDTLNNWEQPMFVNVYGCDRYGYGGGSGRALGETSFRLPGECNQPRALGAVSSVYFCVVACLGGLVLPTLLTAVITASTVHMGVNKEMRSETAEKLAGVVALAPSYLHPKRLVLMEELFENLNVSGDGILSTEELSPAFASLSDEVLKHINPKLVFKLFSLVDKSGDGNVDFSEFLGFFSRLASAMALRLNRPSHEFVQDPVVFEKQFVALCKELTRGNGGAGGGGSSSFAPATVAGTSLQDLEEEDEEGEGGGGAASSPGRGTAGGGGDQSAQDVLAMKRSGAIGVELVEGLAQAGGSVGMWGGTRHEPTTIFDVFDVHQLHRHIKWLASRLEAKTSEANQAKHELRRLKSLLGAFEPSPPADAARRPLPLPGVWASPSLAVNSGRMSRSRTLLQELGAEAHRGHQREQWEAKLSAAKASGGAAAAAAAAVLAGSSSSSTTTMAAGGSRDPSRDRGAGGGGLEARESFASMSSSLPRRGAKVVDSEGALRTGLGLDTGFATAAEAMSTAQDLAAEWQALIAEVAPAVEAREAEAETKRVATADPNQPVAAWSTCGGWTHLARHARSNANVASLEHP